MDSVHSEVLVLEDRVFEMEKKILRSINEVESRREAVQLKLVRKLRGDSVCT